jgi:ectoine hydroxylase-related dioxygenase (phytanoyl-CoA dioxygenase family)
MVPEYFKQLVKAPRITQGDIVFFPPWLKHTVARQTSAKRRLTIAMNLSIFDGGHNEKS